MTDKPDEQPAEPASERPPLADQIKSKMDEYEIDRHLDELATTLEHAVRTGITKVGEFAHEHKDDIERFIDKAAGAVDRRTEGRHADKIQQVAGSLGRGIDKIADQREGAVPDEAPGEAPGPTAPDDPGDGGSGVPPSNG